MNAEKHQIEKIKEFEHKEQLNKNALYTWAEDFLESVRSGKVFTTRVVGIALAAVLAIGLIVFLVRSGRSEKSRVWSDFDAAMSEKSLKEFADQNAKSPAAKVARLQLARIQLGPEGLDRLASKDKETRTKAIASIEKARDEMARLADEFKDDVTLKASCLIAAGEAELALVGIPAADSGSKHRGTVEKAAEYFNQVATAVGPTTKAGEAAKKKADDLLANAQTILMLGVSLNNMLATSALPPLNPDGLGGSTPVKNPPVAPEAIKEPDPKPASAVVGGAAAADPGKKEPGPMPPPGDKK